MLIVAWRRSGSVYTVFDEDFLRRLLSIFITSAVLNLFEGNKNFHMTIIVGMEAFLYKCP